MRFNRRALPWVVCASQAFLAVSVHAQTAAQPTPTQTQTQTQAQATTAQKAVAAEPVETEKQSDEN